MLAALMLSEPFGAELTALCTALFSRRLMPCLRVRRYARLFGAALPPKATLAACALGFRLAPTIQAERESFQRVELEDVLSNH